MGAAAFLAPNPPSLDFLAGAAPTVVEPDVLPAPVEAEVEDINLEAPSLVAGREAEPRDEFDRRDDELTVRGAEAERPIIGGAAGVDGADDVTGFAAGLSHEEKKSSSS